ncbi:hypothetical protein [Dokdonella sp.]|uniref:hypothetical protein n=1 Tax=Dokdonella sp. TaxID=2291710 RepID=UPI0037845951
MRALVFAACFVLPAAWGADGDIDAAFGTDGHVVFAPADASLSAFAVAVTDDDRIVVGGYRWAFALDDMPYQAVVWRLLANGAPDLSFGDGGIVVIPTSAGSPILPAVWSILPLHDGSLLAAGNLGGFGVAHLLADGQLDASFGVGGVATIAFDDLGVEGMAAFAIARDGANRILLAGSGSASVTGVYNSTVGVAARLSVDGMLDTQFASAGRFVFTAGNAMTQQTTTFFGIAGDASDRAWLSGRAQLVPYSANYSALAVRLLADGTPDAAFGTAGIVTANRHVGSDDNMAAGVLRDGRWTIGGVCDPYAGPDTALCMLRIDADGQVDTGFGADGWTSASLGQSFALRNSAITCGTDGRCVLLGTARNPATSLRQFAVLRVDPDGTPDATFGDAGLARITVPADVDGTHITARAIALQDGRPVPAGTTDGVPYVSALYATRLASNAVFDDGFEAR